MSEYEITVRFEAADDDEAQAIVDVIRGGCDEVATVDDFSLREVI